MTTSYVLCVAETSLYGTVMLRKRRAVSTSLPGSASEVDKGSVGVVEVRWPIRALQTPTRHAAIRHRVERRERGRGMKCTRT